MSDIRFLIKPELVENQKLDIFSKVGEIRACITDFSRVLGATPEIGLDKIYGYYWTCSSDGDGNAYSVHPLYDNTNPAKVNNRTIGCRLVKPCESMSEPTLKSIITTSEGIKKYEYGEYPQTVVDEKLGKELESYYQVSCLKETGKTYTVDATEYDDNDKIFRPKSLVEYEYNGKKYVRIEAYVAENDEDSYELTNGAKLTNGGIYWIEVEPIVWLIDEKENLAITEKILFAGIQFDNTKKYHGNFDSTDVKIFIDDYFSKEILSNEMAELQAELQKKVIRVFSSKNYTCASNVLGLAQCTALARLSGYDNKYNLLSDGFDVSRGNRCTCIDVTSGEIVTRLLSVGDNKYGIRPTIKFENENYIINNGKQIDDETYEINIGEFPQNIVDDYEDNNLDGKLVREELVKTGRKYTFHDSNTDFKSNFKPYQYDEYLDKDGNKYIHYIPRDKTIINPRSFDKTHRWVKVEPLTWFYNTKEKLLYTKEVIISGIRCGDGKKNRAFMHTDVHTYLNNYFRQEAFISYGVTKYNQDSDNHSQELKAKKRDNVYDFDLDRVNEEEIIQGSIEGNIPVFLHGESSEGKSARVKQIDPDCVILYLSNATPESLNGKSVYDPNKGEIVDMPPSWYVKLKKKCEEEPDNIHVLFFDELTNALPSIQGMAFNIILDREVNGVWKLPSNCRIAASGNDMDESLAANELAKPLFNRLAHVYIKTTVPNWLNWASKNNIHPAIYAFVAYNGEKVLRTPYNGEKPHADPRRWEMASKMLYATNNPYLLRGIIGEGVTEQLVAFCKQTVITLDDVLNHNYTNEDLKMNVSQKYMTAVGLSLVDEKHVKEVRDFVTNLGAEICATFDSMWCHGDIERIKKLAEIDMLEGGIRR